MSGGGWFPSKFWGTAEDLHNRRTARASCGWAPERNSPVAASRFPALSLPGRPGHGPRGTGQSGHGSAIRAGVTACAIPPRIASGRWSRSDLPNVCRPRGSGRHTVAIAGAAVIDSDAGDDDPMIRPSSAGDAAVAALQRIDELRLGEGYRRG